MGIFWTTKNSPDDRLFGFLRPDDYREGAVVLTYSKSSSAPSRISKMMPEGIPLQRELSTHFAAFQASFGPKQITRPRRFDAAGWRLFW
jgi:hypothetical protein